MVELRQTAGSVEASFVLPIEESHGRRAARIQWNHFTGIFLLSFATLLLELSLTRVLSVANWYHFGFLVVSTALLGFGTSGVVLSLWKELRDDLPLDRTLAALALGFGIVSMISFWLMQKIPFQPFRLLLDHSQLFYTPLAYLVLAAPFFFSGLAISLLLCRGGREANRLYAADLAGAGLGCAAICLVMPAFGGSGAVAVAGLCGALAAFAFDSFRLTKFTLLIGVTAGVLLTLAFVAETVLPVKVVPEKLHPLQPAEESPIYTRWNSFSRVDVFRAPAVPTEGRPDPGFSIIIDAGAAGTAIPDLSIGVANYLAINQKYHPSGLAYIGKVHPKVLIIGSGAGREVLEGLYFGASSITAVEINPIVNEIVTGSMRDQWGGLFTQPTVQLVTEDARSFVRRSHEKYDAIISIQTMSDAALSSGAMAFSGSYVLTSEAFEDYWNHLTPNGTILVTRPVFQIPKLFATSRELFDRLGLGSPSNHLLAFRGVVAPFGHREFLTGFLLQKSPLSAEDVNAMAERLGVGQNQNWGDTGAPELYYSPSAEPSNAFEVQLSDLARSPDLASIYASSAEMIRPATDDQPFFNQRVRWSSLRPYVFRSVLGAGKNGDVIAQPVAEVVLAILFIQTIVVAAAMILLPLARFNRQGLQTRMCATFLTYFAGLGLGFILIEVVFLQRFELYLGQPAYTFSVVLATLLIFAGAGSDLAHRIRTVTYQTLSRYLLVAVGAILFTLLIIPFVFSMTLGMEFPIRVAIAVLLIAPLGVSLGVPFSTGLRLIGKEAPGLVPWAWAINSFFTVIGSVAAMILGMTVGFAAALIVAAACYIAALVAVQTGPALQSRA